MRPRRVLAFLITIAAILAIVYAAAPYARALSLIVRAADLGGQAEAFANDQAQVVTIRPPHMVPTRRGEVLARFYEPQGDASRTLLLLPGIHSMGIEEPRLRALANDLAGSGVRVMTMALPDLQEYRVSPQSSDVIEDAIAWLADQPSLAPDGKVGVVGVSFAGGLSIVAAGRPTVRDKVAFVVSFGGHGDLPRVLKYLSTGEAPHVEGIATHPPHDYGVAVILYGLADHIVPAESVAYCPQRGFVDGICIDMDGHCAREKTKTEVLQKKMAIGAAEIDHRAIAQALCREQPEAVREGVLIGHRDIPE